MALKRDLAALPSAVGSRVVKALRRAAEAPHRSFERLRGVPESKLRIGHRRPIYR